MAEFNRSHRLVSIGNIVGFLIGSVVGGGAIWQWQQIKLEKSKAAKDAHYRIYENFTSYIRVYDDFYRPYINDVCNGKKNEQVNKAIMRMKLLSDAIIADEKDLAQEEGRSERDIFGMAAPCFPTNIRIETREVR